MSNTSESQNEMSTCANCGKGEESSIDLKSCAACKLVKYCCRDCQIAHRPQHKKECKKRAAENMMKSYSNSLRQMKIARYATYVYQR